MKLKDEVQKCLQAWVDSPALAGDDLLMVAPCALRGTDLLARDQRDVLKARFSSGYLSRIEGLYEAERLTEENAALLSADPARNGQVFCREGGFLAALWALCEVSGLGLLADLKRVPICQETIEACELFDLNPYELDAQGALILSSPEGEALAARAKGLGVRALVFGKMTAGNRRMLYTGKDYHDLARPDLKKLFAPGGALHPGPRKEDGC